MTKKTGVYPATSYSPVRLAEAVEAYVAEGGIINVVPEGETRHCPAETKHPLEQADSDSQLRAKIEQLKGLVAKGAGFSALQYSLRMNRKEIKRLASEHGVKILYSRPVRGARNQRDRDPVTVDDAVAGHAMHYSTLGYTVPEIAQLLGLSVRDVLNLGKAYRFELNNTSVQEAQQPDSSRGASCSPAHDEDDTN